MIKIVGTIAFILWGMVEMTIAQDKMVHLRFEPQYKGHILFQSKSTNQEDLLKISRFRWYLSNFSLLKEGVVVWSASQKHYYMDAAIDSTMRVDWAIPKDVDYDALQFNLGIDSVTNTSGAMGGDLDPTKGMYWAWNSGYINLKLEGTHPLCPARKHKFQYHLGGYSGKLNSLQRVVLPTSETSAIVEINLDAFFQAVDITRTYQIMSPSEQAVALSQIAASLFSIQHEKL